MGVFSVVGGGVLKKLPAANSISNKRVSSPCKDDARWPNRREICDKTMANTDFFLIYGESRVIAL